MSTKFLKKVVVVVVVTLALTVGTGLLGNVIGLSLTTNAYACGISLGSGGGGGC